MDKGKVLRRLKRSRYEDQPVANRVYQLPVGATRAFLLALCWILLGSRKPMVKVLRRRDVCGTTSQFSFCGFAGISGWEHRGFLSRHVANCAKILTRRRSSMNQISLVAENRIRNASTRSSSRPAGNFINETPINWSLATLQGIAVICH